MSDDIYVGHKLEQILDEVKAMHELVANVSTRGEFNRLEQKVDNLWNFCCFTAIQASQSCLVYSLRAL